MRKMHMHTDVPDIRIQLLRYPPLRAHIRKDHFLHFLLPDEVKTFLLRFLFVNYYGY